MASLQERLQGEGYQVVTAASLEQAATRLRAQQPDVIMLDPALEDSTGFDALRTLRSKTDAPLMILGPEGQDVDKVVALELGADGYVTMPLGMREILARVRSLLRRSRRMSFGSDRSAVIRASGLEINVERRDVVRAGRHVELRPREFDLLLFLAENAGRTFTREQLLAHVWGYRPYGRTRTVDVHIDRLRRKIEETPKQPQFLITVRGVGYRFEA
jgi:DNA-binding response OmpR family regulator